MYNKKRFLMQHHWPVESTDRPGSGPGGSGKSLIMWLLLIRWHFFLHCRVKSFKGLLLRIGCTFNSGWHHINHNSLCTIGQVLKINKLYTYKEGGVVDIVRLTDVHIERGYLYCSLFFFSKNEIITVRQIMQKDSYIIWYLMENEEFDEAMSMRLWQQVDG